jgi:hypothetical protein
MPQEKEWNVSPLGDQLCDSDGATCAPQFADSNVAMRLQNNFRIVTSIVSFRQSEAVVE